MDRLVFLAYSYKKDSLRNSIMSDDIVALFEKYYSALTLEEEDVAITKLSRAYQRMSDDQKIEFDRIVSDYDNDDGDDYFFDYDGDALASAGFGMDEDY